MERAGIRNMDAYLRKMAIDGYHINLDLTDVRKMVALLHRCAGNVKQIIKYVNETRSIYAEDLKDLRWRYDLLWEAVNKILKGLAKIKGTGIAIRERTSRGRICRDFIRRNNPDNSSFSVWRYSRG